MENKAMNNQPTTTTATDTANTSMYKIVFVCTGNTCRSPMAEILFRHAVEKKGHPFDKLLITSAGLSSYSGSPANEHAITAVENKIGRSDLLRKHHSRSLSEEDELDNADDDEGGSENNGIKTLAYIGMTKSHVSMLSYLLESQHDQPPPNIFLMRQFMNKNNYNDLNNDDDDDEYEEQHNIEIPDPYGMDLEHYEECCDSIMEAIPSLVDAIENICI